MPTDIDKLYHNLPWEDRRYAMTYALTDNQIQDMVRRPTLFVKSYMEENGLSLIPEMINLVARDLMRLAKELQD